MAEDISALAADDACAGSESCSLELLQRRGAQGDEVDDGEDDEVEGDDAKPHTKNACKNNDDMTYWKSPGSEHFHNDLTQCGLKCSGGKTCASACMEDHGYTQPCAKCMGTLGWCALKKCSNQCINKGCQSVFAGCFNGTETEKGKCTEYWMQHNCVTNKADRVYTMSDECVSCQDESKCGHKFEKCSGLDLSAAKLQAHKHVFRWWLNK